MHTQDEENGLTSPRDLGQQIPLEPHLVRPLRLEVLPDPIQDIRSCRRSQVRGSRVQSVVYGPRRAVHQRPWCRRSGQNVPNHLDGIGDCIAMQRPRAQDIVWERREAIILSRTGTDRSIWIAHAGQLDKGPEEGIAALFINVLFTAISAVPYGTSFRQLTLHPSHSHCFHFFRSFAIPHLSHIQPRHQSLPYSVTGTPTAGEAGLTPRNLSPSVAGSM